MIHALIGILIGFFIGFCFGFCFHKKTLDEEIFDFGFSSGFQYGKDSFYNPQAKG